MSLFGRNEGRGDGPQGDAGAEGTGGLTVGRGPSPVRGVLSAATTETGDSVANIGKTIRFNGELTGEEDLVIEGNVEGKVTLPDHQLTIGTNGEVRADVEAKNVVVVGHIAGNVTASERIEVQATGVVDGDVRAPKLVIQEGAVLNGGVEMTSGGKAPAASRSAEASAQAPRRPAPRGPAPPAPQP